MIFLQLATVAGEGSWERIELRRKQTEKVATPRLKKVHNQVIQ